MTTSQRGQSEANEMVSLADRMGYMQVLRVSFVVAVLAAGALAREVVHASLDDLMFVTGAYLALSAGAEGLRRLGRGRGIAVVGGMLLADGLYLAWVMYATGNASSPMRFLVYIHLIAVTLLVSYRTGLKIAMWHSMLLFVSFYAQASGYLARVSGSPGNGPEFRRSAFFAAGAFWLVAVAAALFSSLNERELRRRKQDVEALAHLADDVERAHEADEVGTLLLRAASDAFGFKRGAVLGGPDGAMKLVAYMGPGEPNEPGTGADAVMETAWREHRAILRKQLDGEDDRRLSTLMPMATNVIVAPLFAEGHPLGVLVLEHGGKGSRVDRRIVSMVERFAAHGALALRNAWLLAQVQKMAETDPLTGVANRRVFEKVLEREVARAARAGEQVSLAMFDIDHFKSVNDTYGHQVGDEILQLVAEKLVDECRAFDTTARYGGEEFAVILPSCSSKESLPVVDRLRRSLAEIEALAPITSSAGVATFPTHASDPSSLIRAADEALYESKRNGRDRLTRSRRRSATLASSATGSEAQVL